MILSETLNNEELKLYDKRNKNTTQDQIVKSAGDYEQLSEDEKDRKPASIEEIKEQSK